MSQEDYASDEEMGYEEEEDEGDCYMDDSDGGGSDEDDYAGGEMLGTKKPPYRILTRVSIKERQDECVQKVTSVLGIGEEAAARILRKFKWDVSRVHEEWFSDMEAICKAVGLDPDSLADPPKAPAEDKEDQARGKAKLHPNLTGEQPPRPTSSSNLNNDGFDSLLGPGGGGEGGGEGGLSRCLICFDEVPKALVRSCNDRQCKDHAYCLTCWEGFIANAVSLGPSCLDLRCPTPDCKASVPLSLVRKVCSKDDWDKYVAFQLRSFVEDNKNMAWCTGKGCENAVECLLDRSADEALDVHCDSCATSFCFGCKEEAHRPVSCETVMKWIRKNSAESENLNWILANTKPCPKCHRPIEKSQGCMHMTCSQCKYEFCWLCSGDWKEHGERTGGHYACNRFETAKRKGEYDEETKRKENAKFALERYTHYFERFDAHHKAMAKALLDSKKISSDTLERLSDISRTPASQLKFILEAWAQIVDCRRVLAWTYCFGYYQFMDEAEQENEIKMEEARINAEQEAREAATAAASARKKSAQVQDASGGSNTRGGVASDIRAAFGKARTREGSLPINSATAAAGGHSSGAAGPSSSAGAMVSGAGAGGDKGSMTSAAQRRRTEDLEASKRQREFFEFLQGDAERSLERLHELAEKELGKITNDPTLDFTSFRTSLIGLTDVTRQFFERLVAQLEKGIASMKDDYRAELMVAGPSSSLPAPTATAADAGEEEEGDAMMREVADDDGYEEQEEEEEDGGRGGRAGGGGGGGAGNQRRESKRQRGLAVGSNAQRMNTRSSTATAAATATAPNTDANSRAAVAAATRRDVVVALEEGGGGGDGGDVEMTKEGLERQQGFWTCGNCTFNNTDLDSYECSVCEGPRVEE